MFGNFYFEVKKNKKKKNQERHDIQFVNESFFWAASFWRDSQIALNDSVVNSTDPTAAINNLLIQWSGWSKSR